ncbi:hypothetical protein SERLA73DRAFT_162796 [Serpula lacrymans var. lacrymans S7.3]|uniref:Uncharacterized protein n=1 Tax=Serpula lacrymans var. lacrymans (strain S7.3) TaxID=936435 RepID=F8QA68_SERL3|nr:hypothetical protein SERLA73DRAFT_162796 [Serpula lacrymans var. lacrymans S7.3]
MNAGSFNNSNYRQPPKIPCPSTSASTGTVTSFSLASLMFRPLLSSNGGGHWRMLTLTQALHRFHFVYLKTVLKDAQFFLHWGLGERGSECDIVFVGGIVVWTRDAMCGGSRTKDGGGQQRSRSQGQAHYSQMMTSDKINPTTPYTLHPINERVKKGGYGAALRTRKDKGKSA